MSGQPSNLEMELLISWDTLAHAFVELLNVNSLEKDWETEISTIEYEEVTEINHSGHSEDNMPDMGTEPLYKKVILKEYRPGDEMDRKLILLIIMTQNLYN